MGLFITFIILLSVLAFASVIAAVPSIEDIASEENITTETMSMEDNNEIVAS